MSGPKSLAERLQWMAENLPGFQEELDQANEAIALARAKTKLNGPRPQRSEDAGHSVRALPVQNISAKVGQS